MPATPEKWGLDERALALIRGVFERHACIEEVRVFGSRAMGTYKPESDIDLALYGQVDDLLASRVAGELEELPLPYHFDVHPYPKLRHVPLRNHIDRVSKSLYTRYRSSAKLGA